MGSAVPAPMLATAGRPPVPPGDWAAEMKWDGVRALAHVATDGGVRLFSRNSRDVTGSYPEIAEALTAVAAGRELVLDGELVAPDATGAPSFSRLQRRMHVLAPTPALIGQVRVDYMLFDLLGLDGRPLLRVPYRERRARLEGLGLDDGARVRVPPAWALADVGAEELMARSAAAGLEGIVCKRWDSIYEAGRRSTAWIKTVLRTTTEAVIVGAVPGTGVNAATFGGLVLAAYTPQGRLRCLGGVGTGFSQATRRALRTQLDGIRRDTSPLDEPAPATIARTAWWVEPVLVADIEYREVSGDGLLRHPSFRGLRTDKTPPEVGLPS
ncbi:non-homologous end-joining DNA ligase [Nocardia thailandica]